MSQVVVRKDKETWWIGLNRPQQRNSHGTEMVEELHQIFREARRTSSILVIHSTTPGIFAAGADIKELRDRDADQALMAINSELFERLEAHRWPTIAVIDGPALGGGCEFALACDFRIASPRATFAQPELALGILAGAGGNWRLRQTVGQSIAKQMLYAGLRLDAQAALECGLVDAVTDDPDAYASDLAAKIGRRSWRALELTKLALRQHRPATTGFDAAGQAFLFESADKYERMTKFIEKTARPSEV
jgi:enoyl-CoA hydratase/carnithine racemase